MGMPTSPNYPLRFLPILKERIWGGRRLESVLGKKLPPGRLVGESWEVSDHGEDTSVVANGPHAGSTLRDLVTQFPKSLLGSSPPAGPVDQPTAAPRFPLLVKWIDARERLSVQVHPPDGHSRLLPGERGKTECWLVINAEPGSEIYLGLRQGIDRSMLLRELTRGTVDRCLSAFPARAGDFFFVPAGTVHAIGAGVLLAEIQQSSDTTFRLFDWNRLDPGTARPRPLQVEAALDSIDYSLTTPAPVSVPAGASGPGETILLGPEACRHFVVALRRVRDTKNMHDSSHFHVLVCVSGSGEIAGGGEVLPVTRGDCVVLPAGNQCTFQLRPQLDFLDTWIP